MRAWPVVALVLMGMLAADRACARAYAVQRLDSQDGMVWGTDEFHLTVTPYGTLRHLVVHGQEIVWQAAALYTSPIDPDGDSPVRTVQGEGHGPRGLTVEKPALEEHDEQGSHVWKLRHTVASHDVLGGKPLCQVDQAIRVTPTGEIAVSYDCLWLETLRWEMFTVLLILDKETCADCPFLLVDAASIVRTGVLDVGKGTALTQRLRGLVPEQWTIRPEVGPIHIMPGDNLTGNLQWHGAIQFFLSPAGLPQRTAIPKGHTARIFYRILLPVAQE